MKSLVLLTCIILSFAIHASAFDDDDGDGDHGHGSFGNHHSTFHSNSGWIFFWFIFLILFCFFFIVGGFSVWHWGNVRHRVVRDIYRTSPGGEPQHTHTVTVSTDDYPDDLHGRSYNSRETGSIEGQYQAFGGAPPLGRGTRDSSSILQATAAQKKPSPALKF